MKLFSKLKDYNNMLEEILDFKTFSSISKSLLLSMVYKLEIAYKDYSEVNVDSISKDRFFLNMLDVIKKYCDNIKIVEPESSQAALLEKNNVIAVTNPRERSILTYPTEQAMLYAVCDVEPKFFYIKDDFVFKNTLQRILVDGYKQTTMEILKNFNGWSWEVNSTENYDYVFNLIYKNIMMIRGEDFLFDWRTDNKGNKNYLLEIRNYMKKITGNNNYYLSFCRILSIISDRLKDENVKTSLKRKEKDYRAFLSLDDDARKQNIKKLNDLKIYHNVFNYDNSEYGELIELQKYFLDFIQRKVEKITLKEDIVNIIHELRLYKNLVFSKGVLIGESSDLKEKIDETMKLVITKACKMGILKIISMDIGTNFDILNYILDTRIIDLEETKIYIETENDEIFVKVYDKEIFEKQGKIKFSGNKKDITIKKKRMQRLFN